MAVDWNALSVYTGAPTQTATAPTQVVGTPTRAAHPTSPYGVATPGTAPPPTQPGNPPQLKPTGIPEWEKSLNTAGQNVNRVVAPRLADFTARLRALPHPGGIGLLVVVLVFLLVAVIPMNATGDTRLSLFWKVLTGNMRVFADPSSGQPTDVAGGAIGPTPSGQGFSVGNAQQEVATNPVVTSPGRLNANTLPMAIPVAGGYFEIPQVG